MSCSESTLVLIIGAVVLAAAAGVLGALLHLFMRKG